MNNKDLLKIAEQFGTPTYVYDAESIKIQYEKLTSSFHKSTRFFYACKALSNINILKYVKNLGGSLDCVSINEVKLGLKAGFDAKNILFTPNCVDLAEIEEAMTLKVHINIDNISILEQFGNKYGDAYPIFVRINPHIFAGGNYKISTGHIDSKFGISIHQLRHIERVMKTTNINVEGLHMHTGSEIKDPDVFLQGLEIMFELAEHFPNLKYLDMGSGFKVPYQDGDMETDVKELGKKVEKAVAEFSKNSGKKFELWFEPGKYLVSKSGHLIVKTNVIKQTTATVFCGNKFRFQPFNPSYVLRFLPHHRKSFEPKRCRKNLYRSRKHLRNRYFCMGQKAKRSARRRYIGFPERRRLRFRNELQLQLQTEACRSFIS